VSARLSYALGWLKEWAIDKLRGWIGPIIAEADKSPPALPPAPLVEPLHVRDLQQAVEAFDERLREVQRIMREFTEVAERSRGVCAGVIEELERLRGHVTPSS
jgi:hypothetical protein